MTIIKFKRATSARWAELNPILQAGEPGFEIDTERWKLGDGVSPWNDLPYMNVPIPSSPVTFQDLEDHINSGLPHPIYDDGPSLLLLYENAKV